MATFYLDYEGGNDAADGLSYANRWKTLTNGATAARIAPGDTIRVMASPDPTSLGVTATWTNKSATVTLSSPLNVLIDDCESAWTASANVTCSKDTSNYRTGTGSAAQNIASAFTTGLVAYKALGGAQNYSGYQGITLWVRVNAAVAASTLSIRLCSDAVGAVTVDTLAIPAIPQASQWVPVYIDKGSALGASIQSVALYADADPGAVTVNLDNISTVKASSGGDNLNLTAMISKNTGTETWWCLRGINGATLSIDQSPNMLVSQLASIRGYYGTTETVTTYKRETTELSLVAIGQTNHTIQDSGTAGSPITISGGWNRTDMSTQTGTTWWDQLSGVGVVMACVNKNYIATEKMNFVRGDVGCQFTGNIGIAAGDTTCNHNTTSGFYLNVTSSTVANLTLCSNGSYGAYLHTGRVTSITSINATSTMGGISGYGAYVVIELKGVYIGTLTSCNNANLGFSHSSATISDLTIDTVTCNDNANYGFGLDSDGKIVRVTLGVVTCQNNSAPGLYLGYGGLGNVIKSYTSSGNTNGSIQYGNNSSTGEYSVLKCTTSEGTLVYTSLALGSGGSYFQGRLSLQNINGSTDHRSYMNGGVWTYRSETGANRHTASGLAWKLSPLNATEITSSFPARVLLARLAVNASQLVTVSAWVMRDNTGLTSRLVCKGRQIAGVDNDVVATSSAGAGVYEQLSIVFTPSAAGVVEIEFQAYGGTTYNAYIDDLTITQ